jgi:hypothetical protein
MGLPAVDPALRGETPDRQTFQENNEGTGRDEDMSESNGRCEWESQGYCCQPEYYTKNGFQCSFALPIQPGDITHKCGATEADLITEEEYEEGLKAMRQLIKAHAEKRMEP